MFEITFLGTAASIPTATRSLPAILVKHEGQRFLVDCGEGTQLRLMQAGESLKILHIFLTHDHLDHILGLGGLLFSLSLRRMEPPPQVAVYGGSTTLERAQTLATMTRSSSGREAHLELDFCEISPGIILETNQLKVTAFSTSHREQHPSFGYIFESKGRKRVKLAFTGDTRYTASLVDAANGADCLVSEANFVSDKEELANQVGHLTAAQAARIAAEAGVKCLMLNHVSREYADAPDKVLSEARAIFPNTSLPNDLDTFQISQSGTILAKLSSTTMP